MRKLCLVFFACFTLFNSGCDTGFDIVSEYEEQLVIFMVLDNRADKQILKVQKLQNSFGQPILEKLVEPISARLVHPLGYSIQFKDTVISGVYNYNTLYIDSLDFALGVYRLFVNAGDSLYAWANAAVTPRADLFVGSDDVSYSAYLSANYQIQGAHIKPYLLYSVKQNSEFIEKNVEVPRAIYINQNDTLEIFSSLVKIRGNNAPYHLQLQYTSVQYMRDKLTNYFGAENVRFNNIKFVSYAYDWNLFEYINLHEGYSDQFSVRLDKPNFTNINGGMGIFGAVLADSVTMRMYY